MTDEEQGKNDNKLEAEEAQGCTCGSGMWNWVKRALLQRLNLHDGVEISVITLCPPVSHGVYSNLNQPLSYHDEKQCEMRNQAKACRWKFKKVFHDGNNRIFEDDLSVEEEDGDGKLQYGLEQQDEGVHLIGGIHRLDIFFGASNNDVG